MVAGAPWVFRHHATRELSFSQNLHKLFQSQPSSSEEIGLHIDLEKYQTSLATKRSNPIRIRILLDRYISTTLYLQKASIRFSVLNQANCLLKIHTFEFTGLARPHALDLVEKWGILSMSVN
jgi:hypothetical protein